MCMVQVFKYYYQEVDGPTRNGTSNRKPPIHPSDGCYELSVGDLIGMASELIDWGNNQYANDHGSPTDHQLLVDFVTGAINALTSYAEEW